MELLNHNKEWIFSGIGVFIMSTTLSIMIWYWKSSNREKSFWQKGGDNSNIYQAGGDINIGIDNHKKQKDVLSSNVELVDASLDPQDSNYDQRVQHGKKTIREVVVHPSNIYGKHIYIVYSDDDKKFASKLRWDLQKHGFKIWETTSKTAKLSLIALFLGYRSCTV